MMLYKDLYYYPKIKKLELDVILWLFRHANGAKKRSYAIAAAHLAATSQTGYYSISELEDFFCSVSEQISDLNSETIIPTPNSVLHVATQVYLGAGHTRVIEQWIENTEKNNIQSLVLIHQLNDTEVSETLKKAVSRSGGDIIRLSGDDVEKASQLRKIASQYERIVLHTDPEDYIPILAFGTRSFHTPIVLYNHSDHTFWLGISIADMVADINNNHFSTNVRGASLSKYVGCPIPSSKVNKTSKEECRQRLGISKDEKVILTIGRKDKYKPNRYFDFGRMITQIWQEVPSARCYGMGLGTSIKGWGTDQCVIVDGVAHESQEFSDWLNVADLYIDSVPMTGGLALMDAVLYHIPALSLSTFESLRDQHIYSQHEYFVKTDGFCRTENDLIARAKSVLTDTEYAERLANVEYTSLFAHNSSDAFIERVQEAMRCLPAEHHVHTFTTKVSIDDFCIGNAMVSIKQRPLGKVIWFIKSLRELINIIKSI